MRRRLLIVLAMALVVAGSMVAQCYVVPAHRLRSCRALAARYGRASGLDPALVLAVIRVESAGRPDAVSRAGARGLMQLMPATAEMVAHSAGIRFRGPEDLFQPDLNVRLGTLYLAQLRRRFDGDPYLFIAAYNAGPGAVERWRSENPGLFSRELIDSVAYQETRSYVKLVMRAWRGY